MSVAASILVICFDLPSVGVVLGVGLLGSISTMMGAMYTPPDRPIQKHLFWLVGRTPFSTQSSCSSTASGF